MNWEYRILEFSTDITALEAVLNSFGAVGWELAGLTYVSGWTRLYLKRKV